MFPFERAGEPERLALTSSHTRPPSISRTLQAVVTPRSEPPEWHRDAASVAELADFADAWPNV